MNAFYDLAAPAKLNLYLHITGRRPDGYHLIESIFMLIDWADTLHIEKRKDGEITREDLTSPLPAQDLCIRAALALKAASGTLLGAHIGIAKSIPAEAGLGGGSSDAATCLIALNRLWGLDWPIAKLAAIGLGLGADVPFFLHGHNAQVTGIGEQIRPIVLPSAQFVVVKPPLGLSTPAIFAHPQLKRDTPSAIISGFAGSEQKFDFEFGANGLQAVAMLLNPQVKQAIDCLQSSGLNARMTGSGSAVFAKLPEEMAPINGNVLSGWQQKVCRNLHQHPLAGWVQDKSNT